jgi:hypothetical protein
MQRTKHFTLVLTSNVCVYIVKHYPCFYICAFTLIFVKLSLCSVYVHFLTIGARGGVVVKALSYNRQVAGSIPDGVIGIFQ